MKCTFIYDSWHWKIEICGAEEVALPYNMLNREDKSIFQLNLLYKSSFLFFFVSLKRKREKMNCARSATKKNRPNVGAIRMRVRRQMWMKERKRENTFFLRIRKAIISLLSSSPSTNTIEKGKHLFIYYHFLLFFNLQYNLSI
jgi:hypothetical protein